MANPAFVNSRLTAEQADALAATFRPSWELDEPAASNVSPDATLTEADMARLHAQNGNGAGATMMQNGRHTSEPRIPPAARQASEPEDSVIIDRSITASDLDPRKATQLGMAPPQVPQQQAAPAFPQPQQPPPPVQQMQQLQQTMPLQQPAAPQPASGRVPVAAPVAYAQQAPPPRAYAAPMRASSPDDDLRPAKSKTGLFVGIGAVALVAVIGIVVVAVKSGGSEAPASTSTATAAKTDTPLPNIPPPPALTDTPASTSTSTAAAATTSKPTPTTPATTAKPDKPQRPVAVNPPQTDPTPRPTPPPPKPTARPTVPVKDVPF